MDEARIFALIARHAGDVLCRAPDSISPQGSLADYGANSIDRLEVVTACLEELGLHVPLVEFANVENIAGLIDVLARNVQARGMRAEVPPSGQAR